LADRIEVPDWVWAAVQPKGVVVSDRYAADAFVDPAQEHGAGVVGG
jgi:hypothetical protein